MNIAKINREFEQAITPIKALIDRYPFEDKDYYGYFLNQQYFLISQTTRLIALAASLVDTTDTKEFSWWMEHLNEEMDHDQLILKDLKAINYSYSEQCEPSMRSLYLALFEDIRRNGQNAILGCALMLEGLSMERCQIISERVKSTHGKGYSYLNTHAIADEKHFPEGVARLESFPENQKKIVLENLRMSAYLYRNFLMSISTLRH